MRRESLSSILLLKILRRHGDTSSKQSRPEDVETFQRHSRDSSAKDDYSYAGEKGLSCRSIHLPLWGEVKSERSVVGLRELSQSEYPSYRLEALATGALEIFETVG